MVLAHGRESFLGYAEAFFRTGVVNRADNHILAHGLDVLGHRGSISPLHKQEPVPDALASSVRIRNSELA